MVINLRAPTAAPRNIELGAGNQRPHGLAFLPDGKRMLVTGEKAQRVLLVDLESGAIDSSMVTGQPATHMVVSTRDGLQAFTNNIVAKSVSAIDVVSRKVRATFAVGAIIEGIAVTADGREVWVGGNDSRRVYVLDGSTGALLHTIDGLGMPNRIGITPDKRTAVVPDPGDEKIHVVDVPSHTVRTVIDVPPISGSPASPQGVTISQDGLTAFVTLKAAGRVAVVDIAAGRIMGTLAVGAGSDGVGYSPLVMKR